MSDSGADESRPIVLVVEMVHQLPDEVGDSLGRRRLVEHFPDPGAAHADLRAPPPSGALVRLVSQTHVVQAAQQRRVVGEVRVVVQVQDVAERRPVAGERRVVRLARQVQRQQPPRGVPGVRHHEADLAPDLLDTGDHVQLGAVERR